MSSLGLAARAIEKAGLKDARPAKQAEAVQRSIEEAEYPAATVVVVSKHKNRAMVTVKVAGSHTVAVPNSPGWSLFEELMQAAQSQDTWVQAWRVAIGKWKELRELDEEARAIKQRARDLVGESVVPVIAGAFPNVLDEGWWG